MEKGAGLRLNRTQLLLQNQIAYVVESADVYRSAGGEPLKLGRC